MRYVQSISSSETSGRAKSADGGRRRFIGRMLSHEPISDLGGSLLTQSLFAGGVINSGGILTRSKLPNGLIGAIRVERIF
jgi:hypothetical protein